MFLLILVLGLVDYPQIIKNPMDLGTIKKKFKESKYRYVEEILNDIQLIWDNCKSFNAEGSVIFFFSSKINLALFTFLKFHLSFLYLTM